MRDTLVNLGRKALTGKAIWRIALTLALAATYYGDPHHSKAFGLLVNLAWDWGW